MRHCRVGNTSARTLGDTGFGILAFMLYLFLVVLVFAGLVH